MVNITDLRQAWYGYIVCLLLVLAVFGFSFQGTNIVPQQTILDNSQIPVLEQTSHLPFKDCENQIVLQVSLRIDVKTISKTGLYLFFLPVIQFKNLSNIDQFIPFVVGRFSHQASQLIKVRMLRL